MVGGTLVLPAGQLAGDAFGDLIGEANVTHATLLPVLAGEPVREQFRFGR